jgi:dTDP-L-rhamnose 4-epimerase
MQERLTLTVAPAYGMESVALRLWNVYGSGQALSNPYTGVLAIFGSRLRNGVPPIIFEDGHQRRDFVHVRDVANALVLALEHPRASGGIYNIGSGEHRSVRDVARDLAKAMNLSIEPVISGKARIGDVRHCIADIGKARMELGYTPRCDFVEGLSELAEWIARNNALDRVDESCRELEMHGLVA